MRRQCIHYESSEIYDRHVHIDVEIAEELYAALEDDKFEKKFNYIVKRILEQDFPYYNDYEKLKNLDDVSEMRLFPNGINARIYCKEIYSDEGVMYVIAAQYLPKKSSNEITKKMMQSIKPIEGYEYTF